MRGGVTVRAVLIALVLAILLSGCLPGTGEYGELNQAGFFSGIWHGWFAPLTLIAQLFDSDIRIYELNNTGWWYDFGFYMAVIGGFGSVGLARGRKKKGR